MIRGILTIDQTVSRASYGLFTPLALMRDMRDRQKAAVMENIAAIAAEGDRMAKAYNPANSVPEIAADKYFAAEQLDVGLVYIARPLINYTPSAGGQIDISA